MSETNNNNVFSNDRSLAHRKSAIFWSQLRLREMETERLRVIARLTSDEIDLAQRVCEMECNLLQIESQNSASNESAMDPFRKSLENGRLLDFVLQMQISYNQVQSALQADALSLLREHVARNPHTKTHLVNRGLLIGIVQAMKDFPTNAQLQRDATALLLSFMNDGRGIIDTEGNTIADEPLEGIDLGMLSIMAEMGIFELLLETLQQNLYQVPLPADSDFLQSYARRLAASQIPCVIERIQALVKTKEDAVLLQRKCRFLRTCYATHLNDTTLSATTLNSYVS